MSDSEDGSRRKYAKEEALQAWRDLAVSKIPVILNDIVTELNIRCKADETLKVEGVTYMRDGITLIMYNPKYSKTRQRFTVAHELGHIILEHITPEGIQRIPHSNKIHEQEAQAFANSLLIPAPDLKQFMKPETRTLGDVMQRYDVSKDAAIIALNQNRLMGKLNVDDVL